MFLYLLNIKYNIHDKSDRNCRRQSIWILRSAQGLGAQKEVQGQRR